VTTKVAVEELLSGLGSGTAGGSVGSGCVLATAAVLEITVPEAVPLNTSYEARKVAVSPRAKVGMVQTDWPLVAPTLGKAQLVPLGADTVANDAKDVFAGMASVT
jgi:hypothetical protein